MSRFVELAEGDNLDIDLSEIQAVVFPVEGEEVTIEPSTEEQVILPTTDKKLIKKATVKAVTKDIDANIKPENIVLGKTILGVEGNVAPDKPDQTKTTIPTKERQVVKADTGYELAENIVEPIPDEYINPQGEVEFNENGIYNVREVNTARVNVPIPSGEILIEENNKTYDVKNYETAKVQIADAPKGEFYVKVFDYDGEQIGDTVWLNSGETYTVPTAPPEKKRLTFQRWSCSQDIIDGQITIDDNNVLIGALYTPKSGLTEFRIKVTKATGKNITCNMVGNKTWGDGTSDNLTTHDYADYGEYTITCDGTQIPSNVFGSSSSPSRLALVEFNTANLTAGSAVSSDAFSYCHSLEKGTFNAEFIDGNANYLFDKCSSLKAFVLPCVTGSYMFRDCHNLKTCVVPNTETIMPQNFFENCETLIDVVIPNSVTQTRKNYTGTGGVSAEYVVIPKNVKTVEDNFLKYSRNLKKVSIKDGVIDIKGSFCYEAYNLKEVLISDSVQSIGLSAFHKCYRLERIKMPKTLTSLYGLNYCTALKIVDFSDATIVPTLSGTWSVQYMPDFKIIVPDALYDEWIVATNWSAIANYIYKASEVEL